LGLLVTGALLLVLAIVIPITDWLGPRKRPEDPFLRAKPPVGDDAPDFTLHTPDGQEFRLSAWRNRRPVVLEFGSFT
jgi:hypothetical protein